MRVFGVDPGLTRCGLGVVDGAPGRPLSLAGAGVVRTPAGDAVAARLLALDREIGEWLDRYRPDAVAVERVFSQHNLRTVMGTAQAGAVAIVCAARRGIPVALHTPSEAKAAVTGNGRADKAQVAGMVTRLLRLKDPPRPADTTDALALAICHLWRGAATKRLADAVAVRVAGGHGPSGAAEGPGEDLVARRGVGAPRASGAPQASGSSRASGAPQASGSLGPVVRHRPAVRLGPVVPLGLLVPHRPAVPHQAIQQEVPCDRPRGGRGVLGHAGRRRG